MCACVPKADISVILMKWLKDDQLLTYSAQV